MKKRLNMKRMFLIFTAMCVITAGCAIAGTAAGTLKTEGLCDMCKTRIEKAALKVAGVTKAEWNRETKILTLEFDSAKTNLETISKAVAKAGHDTAKHKADDNVYNNLPGCCKYRERSGQH